MRLLLIPWLFGTMLASAAVPAGKESTMPATSTQTTLTHEGVRLEADFAFDAATQRLAVRYRLHNGSAAAIGVFDRGDTLALKQGRLATGTVGAPATEQGADGLTLQHRAWPLRRPAPTVPPVPLAARVDAGADLSGQFHANVGGAARVRWCLAYATFDDAHFSAPQQVDGIALWRASFNVVSLQQSLCTPWFDPAVQRFES